MTKFFNIVVDVFLVLFFIFLYTAAMCLVSGCTMNNTKYENTNARFDHSGEKRLLSQKEICDMYHSHKVDWYGVILICEGK